MFVRTAYVVAHLLGQDDTEEGGDGRLFLERFRISSLLGHHVLVQQRGGSMLGEEYGDGGEGVVMLRCYGGGHDAGEALRSHLSGCFGEDGEGTSTAWGITEGDWGPRGATGGGSLREISPHANGAQPR